MSGWGDVETEIEGAGAVSEGAYGDDVDACGGDGGDAVESDAAAGFGEGAVGDALDSGAEVGERKVVEQDGVDGVAEEGFE